MDASMLMLHPTLSSSSNNIYLSSQRQHANQKEKD